MRTDGTSAHQRTDTLVAPKFVSFFLFLSLHGYGVYTHSTSPLTVRRLLPPCCQRSPAENKRGGEARPTVSESEEVGADYAAPEEAFRSC